MKTKYVMSCVFVDGGHPSDSKDRVFEGHCGSCPAILV